jgi:signal transduction histidine kinase
VLLDGRSIRNVEVAVQAPSRAAPDHWLVSFFPIPAPHGRNPIGVGEVVVDIGDRKRAELALEKSRAELRRLGAHREGVVEREHQRLAREFHDELGQLLTTARMHLQLLTRLIDGDPAQAKESVRAIDAMIVDAYRSIKTIASDLRPAALNLGLVAAIEWLAERMLRPAGIACTVDCMPEADRLDEDSAIALFRIVQESLTNIVRHAAATRVSIAIRRAGDGLRLIVEDNGKGFDQDGVDRVRQFGLLGMAERVAALGGDLDLDSAPGKGTRVAVTLPRLAAHLASPSPTEPTLTP